MYADTRARVRARDVRAQNLAVNGSTDAAATAALLLLVPLPVLAVLARQLVRVVKEIRSTASMPQHGT